MSHIRLAILAAIFMPAIVLGSKILDWRERIDYAIRLRRHRAALRKKHEGTD